MINAQLAAQGLISKENRLVGAMLIAAPSSANSPQGSAPELLGANHCCIQRMRNIVSCAKG